MRNADVIDLYGRVGIGTKVVLLSINRQHLVQASPFAASLPQGVSNACPIKPYGGRWCVRPDKAPGSGVIRQSNLGPSVPEIRAYLPAKTATVSGSKMLGSIMARRTSSADSFPCSSRAAATRSIAPQCRSTSDFVFA